MSMATSERSHLLTIFDCGSGWTRIEHYFRTAASGAIAVESGGDKKLFPEPLDVVLRAEEEEMMVTFASALSSTLIVDSSAPLVVGCTAGVRAHIADGTISTARIDRFRELLRETVPPTYGVTFDVVSGEREASYELAAARYCVEHGCPEVVACGRPVVGLLSSGGMSSQIVLPNASGGGVAILSLDTALKKEGNAKVLELGPAAGLEHYASYLRGTIAHSPLAGGAFVDDTSSAACVYIAIEMIGAAGERVGLGERVVGRDEAVRAFEVALEEWREAAEQASDAERAQWDWRDAVKATINVQAIALLTMLPRSCAFYFARKFSLTGSDGSGGGEPNVVKPSWSFGFCVERDASGECESEI